MDRSDVVIELFVDSDMEHMDSKDMVNQYKCEKCKTKFVKTHDKQSLQFPTYNFERVKFKSHQIMHWTNPIFLVILSTIVTPVSGSSYNPPESCLGEQQMNIFHSMPKCQSRPTLIDLREMFSNHSEVIQVVPDHVSVERCGGSCYVPAHSCNPTVKSTNMVQVMLVLSKWPHGEHETLCTEVEVEVHHDCECGCRVQPDQCLPGLQYYHQPSCR